MRKVKRIPDIFAGFIVRRPWWVIAIALLLSASVVPGIFMMKTETGTSTLVSSRSQGFKDNERYESQFGGAKITVLLTGQLGDIFSTGNLALIGEFEQKLIQDRRYRSVLSSVTLLQLAKEEAIQAKQGLEAEIAVAQEAAAREAMEAAAAQGLSLAEQEEAAQQAKERVLEGFLAELEAMQEAGEPSLDNPLFVETVLYDSDGSISSAMSSLIPDEQHALIIVTPEGNMGGDEALQAVRDIERFLSEQALEDVNATVVADVKVVDAIGRSIGGSILLLLGLSVGVMIVILLLTFRVRWRLLSLVMVGIGALWTFGLMGYVSVPLSMATMTVLPVLIGLGIDYSIQFHNRYQEEITKSPNVSGAIVTSVTRMFPAVGIALVATIIGFITLYISEVPMVRDFGLVLAVGIIFCYLVGLFLLNCVLYVGDRKTPVARLGREAAQASGRIERILSRVAKLAVKYPLPIFLIALILGVAGGVIDHWLPVNTDYEELIPQDVAELQEVRELRGILGYQGELHFMVEAEDVTDPVVLNWMKAYQDAEIALYPELVSVNSPASLISGAVEGTIPDRQLIERILDSTPSLYVDSVISNDRKTASLSFTVEYGSLEQVNDILQLMEEEAQPPDNVHIAPVGTLTLMSGMVDTVVSKRLIMNILCLGAVFIVLLLVYRRITNTVFTILSVGMVIAWASLSMYAIGIPLNPLTAILGVIIIGIGTEFLVILLVRYDEEKQRGESPKDAMVIAISRIGRAIVTTALTTLGGFGVLIASDFVMIRDFGVATVLGIFLCLVSTITVMPTLIVWLDERIIKRSLNRPDGLR